MESEGSSISVSGHLGLTEYHRLLAAIHSVVEKRGYTEVSIDFTRCTATFAGPMLSVVAMVSRLRHEGTATRIELPDKPRLRSLFRNANWAHLLDPRNHEESDYSGFAHVPAMPFATAAEQRNAVDRMINALLGATPGLARKDLAAIEWSLSEITDNVLTHSEAPAGGLVQLNNFREKRQIELAVSDAGEGIPRTLRKTHQEIRSDAQALERAIREGVTRDKNLGQGNGLYGTFQIARVGKGYLHIHSGRARLDYTDCDLRIRSEAVPSVGTLVVASMDVSRPEVLGEALRFNDRRYEPMDYVETHYETDAPDVLRFLVKDEATSYGSRIAGTPVRTKLGNLVRMHGGHRVLVDFDQVPLVSSSFADEVFGKLFVELGALQFMQSVTFVNVQDTVRALLDRAILQRSREDDQ